MVHKSQSSGYNFLSLLLEFNIIVEMGVLGKKGMRERILKKKKSLEFNLHLGSGTFISPYKIVHSAKQNTIFML